MCLLTPLPDWDLAVCAYSCPNLTGTWQYVPFSRPKLTMVLNFDLAVRAYSRQNLTMGLNYDLAVCANSRPNMTGRLNYDSAVCA